MISFLCLLEGDICSHNLWWDHSELADHSNCCTSFCSLQIRSTGGISCFSFFFLFFPISHMQNNWKRTRLSYFLNVALCLALRGAQRRRGERIKRAVGLTWLLCNPTAQKTEGQQTGASEQPGWRRQGCQPFPHQPAEYLPLHMISVSV